MARAPRKYPDGEGWIGRRVSYFRKGMLCPDNGTVLRMSDSKHLAMFVQFDNSPTPKFCYAADLTLED